MAETPEPASPRAHDRTLWALVGLVLAALLVVALVRYVDLGVSRVMRTAPDAVVAAFRVVTFFGWHWLYWPAAGLAAAAGALYRRRLRGWPAVAAYLFAVVAGSNLVVGVVKRVVGRARPYVEIPPNGPRFEMFASSSDHWSFPSGHACTFLGVTMALALLWPRWRWPLLAVGVVGAFSRVVIDVHFVSDVLVGGAIGAGTALWMRGWFAARGWAFPRRDGRPGGP